MTHYTCHITYYKMVTYQGCMETLTTSFTIDQITVSFTANAPIPTSCSSAVNVTHL